MGKMIWTDESVGCGSYYKNSFGESTVFYPDSAYKYWWRTAWPNWSRDLTYTTGLPMRMTPRHFRGIRNVVLAILAVLAWRNRATLLPKVLAYVAQARKMIGV